MRARICHGRDHFRILHAACTALAAGRERKRYASRKKFSHALWQTSAQLRRNRHTAYSQWVLGKKCTRRAQIDCKNANSNYLSRQARGSRSSNREHAHSPSLDFVYDKFEVYRKEDNRVTSINQLISLGNLANKKWCCRSRWRGGKKRHGSTSINVQYFMRCALI